MSDTIRHGRVTIDRSDVEQKTALVSFRIRPSEMDKLKVEADRCGITPTALARLVVAKWLNSGSDPEKV